MTGDTDDHHGYAARRVLIGCLLGLAAGGATAPFIPWQAATLIGWDSAALVFLVSVWATILHMDATQTKLHAGWEDSSRAVADSIVVTAATACLAAVGLILIVAAQAMGAEKAWLIVVAILSVAHSWAAVHTVFTLRYARNYYSGTAGGIDYNEKDAPEYGDFAYLAFTIGMTFQVSDTDLTSKVMRRTALRHALISYLFGAVIVGLVINVVASLLH